MDEMKVYCAFDKLVSIKDLTPHPKNPNRHSDAQIERLAKILNYQGWRYPIKVSKQTGFITSGHGRLSAAIKNKWESVPVNFQDYENSDQEYADVVSDNSIASWAELDLSGINLELGNLGPDFDLEMLGINGFAMDFCEKDLELKSLAETLREEAGMFLYSIPVPIEHQEVFRGLKKGVALEMILKSLARGGQHD
jgi:ParB-like chromosome segregation protein Spo0J